MKTQTFSEVHGHGRAHVCVCVCVRVRVRVCVCVRVRRAAHVLYGARSCGRRGALLVCYDAVLE
jgi:hypothetical protein